jgi:hypothetical protein
VLHGSEARAALVEIYRRSLVQFKLNSLAVQFVSYRDCLIDCQLPIGPIQAQFSSSIRARSTD